jgi:hypothetical protein
MKIVVQIEHSASSSRSKHEGESSFGLCDRLSRTRDNSQRQLPTDQDYAVSTREYQTDQSSLKTAPTAARSVLELRRKQRQQQTQRLQRLTRSLHIKALALIEVGGDLAARPPKRVRHSRPDKCLFLRPDSKSTTDPTRKSNPERLASTVLRSPHLAHSNRVGMSLLINKAARDQYTTTFEKHYIIQNMAFS